MGDQNAERRVTKGEGNSERKWWDMVDETGREKSGTVGQWTTIMNSPDIPGNNGSLHYTVSEPSPQYQACPSVCLLLQCFPVMGMNNVRYGSLLPPSLHLVHAIRFLF